MKHAEQAVKDLLGRGIKLPPQPKVLVELQEVLCGDDYDVRGLARIIAQDPGLTAMLFKAGRSPLFNRNGRAVDKLDQVLMLIGIKQSFNLIQAMALSTAISDAHRKMFETFWVRSREIARMAALVAEDRVSVCNVFPDQAYLAGIFYECGVPVLMQRFPDYCKNINLERDNGWPSLLEENTRFNVDHGSIGYLVARHWKLPDFIASAIQYHWEMPHIETGATRSMVAILLMGTHLYYRVSQIPDPHWDTLSDEVLSELCLPPEDFKDFFERISERFIAED